MKGDEAVRSVFFLYVFYIGAWFKNGEEDRKKYVVVTSVRSLPNVLSLGHEFKRLIEKLKKGHLFIAQSD
ncbi:hypothetical protein SAMN02982927_02678 [Sporolactobacillus nakayamae]|uniref:Uncharacterized protein n=1 Tax=Sporolactobacillus nakayamae TaxID=269670 RepID=A0A1I2ULL9_9BACL|nr:hypothetical protein SAMN02982927_02678 [Sporolactobacillus nakayamae]